MSVPDQLASTNAIESAVSAVLVVIQRPDAAPSFSKSNLEELVGLVRTMGLEILDSMTVRLGEPHPRYLVGSGKAEEIVARAKETKASCIVFDEDLTPSQQRNWEKLSGLCVIDRHEVILEIFASRASSREASLQVGLARMEYSLPRLTRAWTHLSRQRGGARGTRGEGETQLEIDRRLVVRKIARLKQELELVRAQRDTRRKRRQEGAIPSGSVVGYTNAGKSSLLNVLSGAHVLVEDKLFATLDPTTRRFKLKSGREVLLTDTVGFIRRLPHDLIMAFKSTLEETVLSDFLVHVLDLSNPEVEQHYETTLSVLRELGAGDRPVITVFNKIDAVDRSVAANGGLYANGLLARLPDALFVSARTGEGLDGLEEAIGMLIARERPVLTFDLPGSRHDLLALIHRTGKILREQYEDNLIRVAAQVPERTRNLLAQYLVG